MSEPNDLSPLFQDPSIGALLRDGADAHEPSPADLASLGKKLAAVLPPGTLPPPGGGGGAAPAAAGGGVKLVAAIGVVALLGGAAYLAGNKKEEVAAPPAPSATVAPALSVALEPLVEPTPTASASASAAPVVVAPTPTASTASPAEPEGTMLARAHDALLHGAPDQALAIANEHAKAYPNGALAQERDFIVIEALVASNREGEAWRKASEFRAKYPGSSHQERIDRLVR